MADHIDHAVQIVGPAHVARGLDDVAPLPNLTAALLARGHGEADLAAILGGNWPRLLAATGG